MQPTPARQRGLSLVEALIALAVTASGLLGVLGTQAGLRLNADVARQRSEALRSAQAALEDARRFATVQPSPGQRAWDDLAGQPAQPVAGGSSNTRYIVESQVSDGGALPVKTMQVTLRWQDRTATGQAENQRLQLTSVIAAAAPALSGRLALPSDRLPIARPLGRHVAIPVTAQDLGNGRSAFIAAPGLAWVFSNASGHITGQCSVATLNPALNAEALASCSDNTNARLLSGYVRFLPAAGTAADVAQPGGSALNLDIALSTGGATCVDDAPATATPGQQVVRYHCLVPVAAGSGWSGASRVVPQAFAGDNAGAWTVGDSGANAYQVCRYTPVASPTQAVANADHPASYANVNTALLHQNFLVVPAALGCPAGTQVLA